MKKKISIWGLTVLTASLALAGCGEKKETTPKQPEVITRDPETKRIETKFKLTVDCEEGVSVKFEDDVTTDTELSGGQLVRFTLSLDNPTTTKVGTVTIEDVPVSKNSLGVYSFRMPNKAGALLKVTLEEIVQDVVNVKDVDETTIPTLAKEDFADAEKGLAGFESIKTMLDKADEVEPLYLKKGTLVESGADSYGLINGLTGQENSVSFRAGKDNIRFAQAYSTSSDKNPSYKTSEKGIVKNFYYTATEKRSFAGSSQTISGTEEFLYKKIIADADAYITNDDGTKKNNYTASMEIPESEAESNVRKTGAISAFKKRFDNDMLSFNYMWDRSNVTNSILNFEHTVSDDKKSYTLYLKTDAYSQLGGLSYYIYEGTFVVDGNQYIRSIDFKKTTYDGNDYDTTTKTLKASATIKDVVTQKLVNEVGSADDSQVPIDIEKYAMKDYDIQLQYRMSYDSRLKVRYINDTTVQNGAIIDLENIHYSSNDNVNSTGYVGAIVPTLVGIQDSDKDFVKEDKNNNTYTVLKEGKFHLVFDDGFGNQNVVEYTSVQPSPYEMNATIKSADGKDYVYVEDNGTFTVTASITPTEASQQIDYALDQNNVTGATVTAGQDTEDGKKTFVISPTKTGEGTITLSSRVDKSINTVLSFTVMNKPTAAGVKNTLFNKTLVLAVNVNYSSRPFVNFKEDGTGDIAMPSSSGSTTYSSYIGTFTWQLDEETMEMTVTQGTALPSTSYYGVKFTGMTILGDALFTGTFKGGYSNRTETGDFKVVDRIADFSTEKFTW